MPLLEELEAENARLLSPLSPTPQGTDISVTIEFEAVKAEIDKLNAVSGIGPNWAVVEKSAIALLTSTSKDLRLAVWIAAARVQLGAWRGVASGLSLVTGMVKTYWDTMFPDVRRARGRANLYAWYTEQAAALEVRDATIADVEALAVAEQKFAELDAFLADKLGDAHPGRGRLHGVLRNKSRAVAELVQQQPAPTAPTASADATAARPDVSPSNAERDPFAPNVPPPAPRPVPTVAVAVPVRATLGTDLAAGLLELSNSIDRFSTAVLASDEKDPLGFRLRRAAAWMNVRQLTHSAGRVAFTDPRPDHVRLIKDTGQPRWILRDSEAQLARYPLWLDPNRVSADKLEVLGFADARDEVTRLTADFVRRFPELLELTFRGGMPCADDATKRWLRDALGAVGGGPAASGGAGDATSQDAAASSLEIAAAEAMNLVGKGQIADGLAHLVDSAVHAGSGRDRFRGMLRAGRLALDAASPEVARAIFQGCLADIDRHQLEVWDPSICSEVYTNLIAVLRNLPRMSLEQAALEASLFERLCRIDPRAAVHLAQR